MAGILGRLVVVGDSELGCPRSVKDARRWLRRPKRMERMKLMIGIKIVFRDGQRRWGLSEDIARERWDCHHVQRHRRV